MRTHFGINPPFSTAVVSACGVGRRIDTDTRRVDCLNCQRQDSFILAKDEADSAREKAFQEQTPHTVVPQFGRVNDDGVMDCSYCGGVLFRERPRSLFSYHFVCANEECGKSMHPMTETG